MQRVPAAGRPPGDDRDDDLGHEPDEALHLEDVQAAGRAPVDGADGLVVRVLVAVAAADALVAAASRTPSRRPSGSGRCR